MSRSAEALGRFNPVTLWIDGLDWFGRSRRTAFVLAWGAAILCLAVFEVGRARSGWPGAIPVIAILTLAVITVPVVGHTLRRLTDLGWSGWWIWLLAVPVAGIVLLLVLASRRGRLTVRQSDSGWRTVGWALACVLALLVAARAVWSPAIAVSEAMSPTVQPGDLVAVNTAVRRYRRGDVVVFRHPVTGRDSIMRLIGLPGERVQLRDGLLYIDEAPVTVAADGVFSQPYGPRGPAGVYPLCGNGVVGLGAACDKPRAIETLPGGVRHAILDVGRRSLDDTGVVTVPEGHVFVLGDNRDNAGDSRVPQARGGTGLVPRDSLAGRVSAVILSGAGRSLLQVWTWRRDRMMKVVR